MSGLESMVRRICGKSAGRIIVLLWRIKTSGRRCCNPEAVVLYQKRVIVDYRFYINRICNSERPIDSGYKQLDETNRIRKFYSVYGAACRPAWMGIARRLPSGDDHVSTADLRRRRRRRSASVKFDPLCDQALLIFTNFSPRGDAEGRRGQSSYQC